MPKLVIIWCSWLHKFFENPFIGCIDVNPETTVFEMELKTIELARQKMYENKRIGGHLEFIEIQNSERVILQHPDATVADLSLEENPLIFVDLPLVFSINFGDKASNTMLFNISTNSTMLDMKKFLERKTSQKVKGQQILILPSCKELSVKNTEKLLELEKKLATLGSAGYNRFEVVPQTNETNGKSAQKE